MTPTLCLCGVPPTQCSTLTFVSTDMLYDVSIRFDPFNR
jgi:hypothetical protein